MANTTNTNATEWHIASMVLWVEPLNIQDVCFKLSHLPGTEVHGFDHEAGKVVVLLEAKDQSQLMETMEHMNQLPGVISSQLVYHEIDINDSSCDEADYHFA